MSSTWESLAASKRARAASLLPTEWLLPSKYLNLPLGSDVTSVPRECRMLTERELEITEEDEVEVLLEKMRDGDWSAKEVMVAYCKRACIAQQLVACITEPLFDRAIKRAEELDEYRAKTGRTIGPLHGLPVSLKEQFDIEGVEQTMGFTARIGYVSPKSCVLVVLLEKLGAVPHCRTTVPQTLLCDETISHIFGRTLNPHNTSLTAGGSSGGEAALLALKGSPIGFGTDLGGSIRKPASFCGLYGLRPTTRRLPYEGASNVFKGAESLESTIGPMGRSGRGLEVVMSALIAARPYEKDMKVVERKWEKKDGSRKKKFAVMWSDGEVRCHPPLERALRETVEKLTTAGHIVVDWEPIDHAGGQEIVSRIFDTDGGEDVRKWLGDTGEPILPQVFTSSHPAMSMYESWQLNKKRDAYRQQFQAAWRATGDEEGNRVDAILCANAPHVAEKHLDGPRPGGLITYTTIWSLLDLPCVTFPVTKVDPHLDPIDSSYEGKNEVDRENWAQYTPERYDNAPVCLQLISPQRFHEDELMGLLGRVESAMGR